MPSNGIPRARGQAGMGADSRPKASGCYRTWVAGVAHLTRLLRLGEVTAVTVPEAGVEAVPDLVRAREDARADLMRVRHRLSKLLLRQPRTIQVGGFGPECMKPGCIGNDSMTSTPWRPAITTSTRCSPPPRRDRLDEQIVTVAASPRWVDPVDRLGCLRGISALTGLALTVEIGDWSRFSGSSIGAYVGLVPTDPTGAAPRHFIAQERWESEGGASALFPGAGTGSRLTPGSFHSAVGIGLGANWFQR